MKSNWNGGSYRLKTIKLELQKKGKGWSQPKNLKLRIGSLEINAQHHLTLKQKLDEVDIMFDTEEEVQKVRATNIEGWGSTNIVVHEIFIQ